MCRKPSCDSDGWQDPAREKQELVREELLVQGKGAEWEGLRDWI